MKTVHSLILWDLVLWGRQVLEEMSLDEKTAVSSYIEKLGIVVET